MERFWNWITFNTPPTNELVEAVGALFLMIPGIALIFAVFLLFSLLFYGIFSLGLERLQQKSSFELQKTVSFGDAASVRSIWFASVTSILAILFIWSLATGSKLLPFTLPTPYVGTTQFEYTATNAAGQTDTASVKVVINPFSQKPN